MSFRTAALFAESGLYNKDLHSKFWFNKKFDQGIREKLLRIAQDFIENSKVDVEIDDIQLTGSLANYNYNKHSDLDVHILLNYSKINDDTGLVKQALDGKRFVWNLRHNVVIRDHEIELYYQDTKEPHIASGLFSLADNKWLIEPKYNPPTIDIADVDKKAHSILDHIDRLYNEINDNDDSEHAKVLHRYGRKLKEKIHKMRKTGLEREGEFSIENLAFKKLRNSGSIGTLIDLITKSYEQIYSENVEPDLKIDSSTFRKFFNGESEPADPMFKKGPRQQKWGTGGGRLHQNLVPDMHKVDGSLNNKVETLRERPGKLVLSQADVNYCRDKYKVDIDPKLTRDDPKQLGTSEIFLYFDPKLNVYVIEKQ